MNPTLVEVKKETKMENRCIWCNKKSDNLRQVAIIKSNRYALRPQKESFYVHRSHERQFRSFANKVKRHGKSLLYLFVSAIIALIGFEIILITYDRVIGLVGISIVTTIMGLMFILFPFATTGTIKKIGASTATKLVKTAGIAIVAVGIYLLILSF